MAAKLSVNLMNVETSAIFVRYCNNADRACPAATSVAPIGDRDASADEDNDRLVSA